MLDYPSLLSVIALVLLIIFSAFLAATEIAFTSMNRIRMKSLSDNGDKRAARTLSLYNNYDKLLTTILVGNNVVNIAATSIATVLFINILGDFGATLSAVTMTVVILVFGEITPKSLAKDSPEKFAMFATPVIHFLMIILTPVNYLFIQWKKLLGMVFKAPADGKAITEDDLLKTVEEAEHDGAINKDDRQLIQNVIEFTDREVGDILTPRTEIIAIDNNEFDMEHIADMFIETGYSRLPIYNGSIDNIVGVIHIRDFFGCKLGTGQPFDTIISPVVFCAPNEGIHDLFKRLQSKKCHIAIVTDEYGGTAGMVTMEDILEELVGEIWDESDDIIEHFIPAGENKYRVLCGIEADKMFDFFDVDGESDAATVGGWIMETLEKIPEVGDGFEYKNLLVTVHKVENRKISECTIEKMENVTA